LQTLDDDVALAVRQKTDLLFFIVDIDRFKAVNDRFGHHAGDEILVQVARGLRAALRDSDYLVRWGGEEFLVVARSSRREDAPEIAERLRRAAGHGQFTLESGQPIALTVSIGFAVFPFLPEYPRALTWSQIVDLADHALYMAKNRGRDAWFGLSPNERTDSGFMTRARAATAAEVVNIGHLRVVQSETHAESER
jgi:diguanylate cyclase (GGDEF)-like protein